MPLNSLAGLALSQLFNLGKPLAVEEAVQQVEAAVNDRKDNVAKNDREHGWSATNVGDPKNDYPGDALSKRLDNALFVYGMALPGKVTDGIRDALSPSITPGLRAQVDENTTPEEIAELVGNALIEEVRKLAGKV